MANRILLLMDNRADSNWGSQASTGMLVWLLLKRFPQAEIRGVPRDLAGHRGIFRKIGERFLPEALLSGDWNSTGARIGIRATTLKWGELLDWPDLIVVNGEGTLHPQRQLLRWLPLIRYIHQRSRAPVWVLNASMDIGDPTYRPLFQKALAGIGRLVVREPKSLAAAREIAPFAELAADCAFLAEPDPYFRVFDFLDRIDVRHPFAIVTGSAIGRRWNVEATRSLLETLRDGGLDLVFATSTEDDETLRRRINPKLRVVTERDLTPGQYIALLREAQLLLGGRFHPTIFAATVGTPFLVSSSNTRKMEGLLQMLGVPELLVPQGDANAQTSMLGTLMREHRTYSRKLYARAAELREAALQNVPTASPGSAFHA